VFDELPDPTSLGQPWLSPSGHGCGSLLDPMPLDSTIC
jgi:hypothetical protein